jgi:hypothetical protein
VRHAYLGPRLADLAPGCLPDAFEADERATADCTDLLQLVAGRQVLGCVRERRLELLAAQRAAAAALADDRPAALGGGGQQAAADAAAAGRCDGAGEGREGAGGRREQDCQQPAASQQAQQAQQAHRAQQEREADVVDLYLGGELVASAVRRFPRSASAAGSGGDSAAAPPSALQEQQQQQQRPGMLPGPDALPAEVIGVYGRGGELLAQVEAQQLDPGSATASSARLLSPAGRHTHTVYRTQTPLVRHLTFAAEPAATGLQGTTRPSRLVVCRARRAWLPPSSLWLFKPLAHTHDIGAALPGPRPAAALHAAAAALPAASACAALAARIGGS